MADKKISVLFVEDNKLARKMARIILEQLNCMVDLVETGRMAIEYANKSNYDIIFMDIGLPDVDGLTVIEYIRNTKGKNHYSPIIALTAHSDQEYVNQSYEVGANDYLVKPLDGQVGKKILEKYVPFCLSM